MSRRQRIISGAIAGVLVLTAVVPTVLHIVETRRYQLDDATRALVGSVNSNLAAKLTYDSKGTQWQFNKASESAPASNIPASLVAQAGGGGKNDESLYRTDFPKDPKKGVTFTDTQTELAFTMTPEFKLYNGQASDDGRLIYPMGGGAKLIYTAKNNGMKEDIVLPKFIGKELSYSYALNLPKTLEAKIQSDGSVGVFSADPILFGKISTGSDMDAEKLKSARENGKKTHLLFAIPAPVIVHSGDKPVKATAKFGLNGDVLTVTARDMDKVQYPASVDPSVVVTSSSEFESGNNENNIYYSTDQINRGKVTGGTVGTWSTTTPMNLAMEKISSVAYNGYLYRLGGYTRSPAGTYETTEYAPINSNGTLGSWASTTDLPAKYSTTEIVAYNGYMYLIADVAYVTSSTNVATTYYSKINANGTIGAWNTTTALPQAIVNHAVVATDGYIYTLGGSPTSGGSCGANGDCMTTVYYAPLNANGTIGTWNTTSSFTTARAVAAATSYNGYIYIGGGGNTGYLNDVQYARINSDGTLGSWMTTTSFANARYGHQFHAHNGYMYMYSGRGGGVGWYSDVQMAQINANGTLGTWTATTSFTNGRAYGGGEIYNGYLYMLGGYNGSINYGDVQYAKIDNPGMASTSTASTTFGGAIDASTEGAGFMYNGYLYYAGGNNGTSYITQVRYAAINSSGTVGTWNTTSALQAPATGGTGLSASAYAIYNNRIYLIGGLTTVAGSDVRVSTIQYASFNTNGTLGSWTINTTDLPFTTAHRSAAVYNGHVYMNGPNGSGATDRIYRAPMNSNGTIGSWTWDGGGTNNLPVASGYNSILTHNKFLYVIGGHNGSNYLSDVQFAPINSDGTLGTWATTSSLQTAKSLSPATIVNGYMYVVGGEVAGPAYTQAVEYAKINIDGTLGAWQSSTNLSVTATQYGIASWNDRIYVISGRQNGSRVKNVLYITTRSGGGGAAGSWSTSANSLSSPYPDGIVNSSMFVHDGHLYTVGGFSNSVRVATTWSTPLNSDGSVGTWTQQASMPSGRESFALGVSGQYVYACTGVKSGNIKANDCTYAELQSGGGLGNWSSEQTMSLSAGSVPVRRNASGVVYEGYLYVLAGSDSSAYSTVYYAALNPNNGSLGTWQTGTSFTTARSAAMVFAANGYLYVLGGATGVDGSGTPLADIQRASLNPADGSVGSWQATSSLVRPRTFGIVAHANGFVYVYGGTNAAGGLNYPEQTTLLPNGELGDWQRSGASTFSPSRSGAGGVIANGYIYLSSGLTGGGTYMNDVQYAPLNVQPRIGRYSKLFDLGALYSLSSITYGGSLVGGKSAISYQTAGSNGQFGSSAKASALNNASACAAGDVRYVLVNLTIDDTSRAALADENSIESYVSHLSVNYVQNHAPTDKRLAHGKFFEDEALQPLDTCSV